MCIRDRFPSLMPTLYPGSMATGPKPYASLDEMWTAFSDLSNNKTPAINGDKFFSLPLSSGVRSSAPSGPRPAGHGRGQGRVASQTPSWQMGSSNNPIVMSVIDSADPWTDNTSKCWPLEEHHYAEVFAVCASFETDDPPLWSALLALRPRRCPPRKSGALPKLSRKTRTLSGTADTPLSMRVDV